MKTSEIKNRWEQFRAQRGYLQRLDPDHPMDFFIGINEKGFDELVLITVIEPAQMRSSKALEIEKGQRKDGKWATQIASVEKKNEDIFARLCLDLIEVSQFVTSEQEGLNRITNRFLAWQRLFSTMHTDLPKSVLKGMVGEISFAREVLSAHFSLDEILSAWLGPDGADRDYIFSENWFEIKSIATGKDLLTISSLNQLETENNGYIVKYNVDESSEMDPAAESISALVNGMREFLQSSPQASQLFEQKLVSLGYIDKKSYESIYFTHSAPVYYKVDSTFPKLTTHDVPSEIIGARYDLSLAGIDMWKKEDGEVWN